MPRTIEVSGRRVEFPDSMSEEQVLAALKRLSAPKPAPKPKPKPEFIPEPDIDLGADIRASGQPTELVGDDFEPKGRVVRAPQPIVSAPMAREPLLTKPVDLPEPRPLESEAEKAIREATQAGLGAVIPTGLARPVSEEEAAIAKRLRQQQERQRSMIVQPGRETPSEVTEGGGPLFRPTEIRQRQTFKVPDAYPLTEAGQWLPVEDLPEVLRGEPYALESRVERLVQDPESGVYRTPTFAEEMAESFALQPLETEASARQKEKALYAEQLAREKGYYGDTPFFDQPGSMLGQVFEQPDVEGRGLMETDLASVLRSTMSWASAAAAEGYFQGLGYEVDEQGMPRDPESWGYALKQLRDELGIPDVIGVAADIPDWVRESAVGEELGLPSRFGFAVPTPGVKTARTEAKASTFDPEGRRTVDPLAVDAETRIAQAVAKGRTWGDELASSPEVAKWFLANTGDPDHAYLSGLAIELLMPAGPELAGGLIGYAAGVGADLSRIGPKLARVARLKKAEKAVDAAQASRNMAHARLADVRIATKGRRTKSMDFAVKAARKADDALEAAATDVLELRKAVTTGFDPKLGSAVARKAVKKVGTAEQVTALTRVLKGDLPDTFEGLKSAVTTALKDRDKAEAAMRLVSQNLPSDMVALTDDIAVPRTMLAESKKILARNRKALFQRRPYEQGLYLEMLAKGLPDGPAQRAALKLAGDIQKEMDSLGVSLFPPATIAPKISAPRGVSVGQGASFFGPEPVMTKALEKRLKTVAKALTKEAKKAGKETDVLRFVKDRTPQEFFETVNPSFAGAERLKGVKSWDDVPMDLRRQAITLHDLSTIDDYGDLARLTRDLTRAQMFFESAERGVGDLVRNSDFFSVKRDGLIRRLARGLRSTEDVSDQSAYRMAVNLINDALFDPEGLRTLRLKARFDPRLYRETALVARAGKEVEQAAATVIRTYGQKLQRLAQSEGSADKAMERLMRAEIENVNPKGGAEEAWDTILDSLYGGEVKNKLKPLLARDSDTVWKDLGVVKTVDPETGAISAEFTKYPTIRQVKDVDLHYTRQGDLTGVAGAVLGSRYATGPDVQMAFIKAGVENGLKKDIIAKKLLTTQVKAAVPEEASFAPPYIKDGPDDAGMPFSAWAASLAQPQTKGEAERAARTLMANPASGSFNQLPPYLKGMLSPRYSSIPGDTIVANQINEGAEALFRMLEGVPVKQRAYLTSNVLTDFLGKTARNLATRWNTGYILPNIVPGAERIASTAITPMVTLGVGRAMRAYGRQGREAVRKVFSRRKHGGGLTTPDGQYLSPKMLEGMAAEYGIGVSRLESARVGSLATDIRNDARAAARAVGAHKGLKKEWFQFLFDEVNPAGKSYWYSLADGFERNYRKSVFETALAAGETPDNAAALARRSHFDYAATPSVLKEKVAQLFGNAGFAYHAGLQLMSGALNSPKKVNALIKAHREQAKAQDPYNLHGDAALKSLHILKLGGEEFYLPSNPALVPIEEAVALARRGDRFLDNVRFAMNQTDDGLSAVVEGGESVLYNGMLGAASLGVDALLPSVLESYDRFMAGDSYKSQDVPEAAQMSDDKMFWAMALVANAKDPYHQEGGAWGTFVSIFPHERIAPPPELADPTDPTGRRWLSQPPDGIPHLLWEPEPGKLPTYYAIKPKGEALRRIRAMRTIDFAGLDRALPFYAASVEGPSDAELGITKEGDEVGPSRFYPEGRVPETVGEATLELLPRVTGGGRAAQVQQRQLMKDIREDIEVKSE